MQEMLKSGVREAGGTSQSLNGYVTSDTDWGGKTGTSNNHSDAWFVGVSPHLVVGAWVGGEYRCIHFRTGALGQGSRTALPICGYFLQKVMNDPAFRKYHAHFSKPDDVDVEPYMYQCDYIEHVDTLDADTIIADYPDEEFNEEVEGILNDINKQSATPPSGSQNRQQNPSGNDAKKSSPGNKPREEQVTFDNI